MGRVPCNVRRFQKDHFTLWRCTGCGSIHCKEEVNLSAYYSDYPITRIQLGLGTKIAYRNRLKFLRRHGFREEHRCLDFGCGGGLFVEYLRANGFKNVEGYDAFTEEFAHANLSAGSYDAVVSYDVIEHDDDPREFLKRTSRLLRSKGLLIIGTPRADGVSLKRTRSPALHPPYHRHILSEQSLIDLALAEGLKLEGLTQRSYYDSLVPTVNSRFAWEYVAQSGGFIDVAVEPPRVSLVLTSPVLLLWAVAGYFFPGGENLIGAFRKV
jgi:SAM-dependent methyltransferase